jgi:hypothetical protein
MGLLQWICSRVHLHQLLLLVGETLDHIIIDFVHFHHPSTVEESMSGSFQRWVLATHVFQSLLTSFTHEQLFVNPIRLMSV